MAVVLRAVAGPYKGDVRADGGPDSASDGAAGVPDVAEAPRSPAPLAVGRAKGKKRRTKTLGNVRARDPQRISLAKDPLISSDYLCIGVPFWRRLLELA